MKVTISFAADADIFDIAAYVAQYSRRASEDLANRLFDECRSLVPWPERFAIVEEVGRPGLRRCPVGDYLIFYVVLPEEVVVIRVLHGAHDYARLLAEG